jgi:hypothetical protein
LGFGRPSIFLAVALAASLNFPAVKKGFGAG